MVPDSVEDNVIIPPNGISSPKEDDKDTLTKACLDALVGESLSQLFFIGS